MEYILCCHMISISPNCVTRRVQLQAETMVQDVNGKMLKALLQVADKNLNLML